MLARIFIVLVAPFTISWAFVSTFWREVKSAPWYAWNEARMDFDTARRAWRAKSINPENWS